MQTHDSSQSLERQLIRMVVLAALDDFPDEGPEALAERITRFIDIVHTGVTAGRRAPAV